MWTLTGKRWPRAIRGYLKKFESQLEITGTHCHHLHIAIHPHSISSSPQMSSNLKRPVGEPNCMFKAMEDLETRSIVKARHLMSVLQDQVSGMHAHPQRLQQANYSQTRRSLLTSSSLAEYYGLYWQTQQWPQVWKRSIFIPQSKKSNAKECTNYRAIALISHASKVMLKILQARLQ